MTLSVLSNQAIQRSPLLVLPIECKLKIIDLLHPGDVANLRLACQALAVISIQGLFTVTKDNSVERGILSVKPNVDGMAKLASVSHAPWVARCIKHIKIFIGDIDMEFLKITGKQIWPLLPQRYARLVEFEKQIEFYSSKHCNYDLLCAAFSGFENVESLTITSMECPVSQQNIIVHETWSAMTASFRRSSMVRFQNPQVAIRRFENILLAAVGYLKIPLKNLAVDMLPLQVLPCLGPRPLPLEIDVAIHQCLQLVIIDFLSHIQSLRIGLSRANPFLTSWAEFERLLNGLHNAMASMLQLRHLQIDWNGSRGPIVNMQDWLISLYASHWPHLESLQINHLPSPQALLSAFIMKHSSSLRKLSLVESLDSYEHFSNDEPTFIEAYKTQQVTPGPSVKNLLTTLRETMKLEKLQFVLGADDHISINHRCRIYDTYWNETVGAPDIEKRITARLEQYVVGKCDWPLEEDRPWSRSVWGKLNSSESRQHVVSICPIPQVRG